MTGEESEIVSKASGAPGISLREWLSRIVQSKGREEYTERTALFGEALAAIPDSFVLWIKYFEHVKDAVARNETTLGDHSSRIEDGIAALKLFPGMWVAVANLYLSAGKFSHARTVFERAFSCVSPGQHKVLWRSYCDIVKSNKFFSTEARISVFQRATAHSPRYSRELFQALMKQGNITRAFRVLVDHASWIGQDPIDFLSRYDSDVLDPETVVGYLHHEKGRLTGNIERMSSIYLGVINFLIRSKLNTKVRDFFHSELRSCDYDFYPVLFEKYIDFQHHDFSIGTPREELIDAYEKFVLEQPTVRTLSILRKYPDNICFLQRWLKTLENDAKRFIEEFQGALLATKKTPHCEMLWIRFAYWYEMRNDTCSARKLYETALAEIDFCSTGAFFNLVHQYVEFLLRQNDWKTAIRLLRHLTATNADSVNAPTPNTSIVQQSWKCKRVWALYIHVCRTHSTPDATSLVYDRMISLGMAGERDILNYSQYLMEHRDLFATKVNIILRDAVRSFPQSLELWHRYITHSVDSRLSIRSVGLLAQQFLRSQGIDFLKLDLFTPCSLVLGSASIPAKKLLEKYDMDRFLCLRNLMGVFMHALEKDTHACAQMYFAFLRVDLILGLRSGFDAIAHQACASILRECLVFLRQNNYEYQIEEVLLKLRDDITEVFFAYSDAFTKENGSAEHIFHFITGLARLQRNEACAQLNFSSARQILSSTADWIPRLKTFHESDDFWMVWMEFEEMHGSYLTLVDMYKAWNSVMEVIEAS